MDDQSTMDTLRAALAKLAAAVEAYLDSSRSPAEWATDRSKLHIAAKEAAALAASVTDEGHEHYWTDAHDDEEAWHCTICGVTEYPASSTDEGRLVDIIEQAIFETDTGLEAALLASERIAREHAALRSHNAAEWDRVQRDAEAMTDDEYQAVIDDLARPLSESSDD